MENNLEVASEMGNVKLDTLVTYLYHNCLLNALDSVVSKRWNRTGCHNIEIKWLPEQHSNNTGKKIV